MLLDTVSGLRRIRPDVRLVLVGDGPERASLEAHARALGLSGVVDFRGQLPHRELLEVYLQADVLVLGSRYEGMPWVFLDAGATGLPIVSTPVADAVKLSQRAPVPTAEAIPEALGRAIAETLDDVDLRHGRANGSDR